VAEPPKVAGLILAAGKSERMGCPKSFLEYRGGTFLSVLYGTLKASPLMAVRVVFGCRADEFVARAGLPPEEVVLNPNYETGMLSSVQAGLGSLENLSPDAVMLFPVDQPAVSVKLIERMIQAFRESGKAVVLPVHDGRRGHPVLFGRSVFAELMCAPHEVGARAVVRAEPARVLELEAGDESVLLDVDTPADYEALRERERQD
jgi:molybdenum cofactor cytidylyltransferase